MSENLILTKDEAEYLAWTMQRNMQGKEAANTPSKLEQDKIYLAYKRLAQIIGTPPQDALALHKVVVNRSDVRILQSLLGAHKKALIEHTIPGYEEKMTKPDEDKKRLQIYLDKAKSLVALLEKVEKKVDGCL